jgi:hypothetical protein
MTEPSGAREIYDDEISLVDLFVKLWRRRGLIIVLPLFAVGVALVGLLFTATQRPLPVTLYVELIGIEKAAYPNGARFSPKDLKAPEVLNNLAKKYGIDDPGELAESLAVEFGSPLIVGVKQRFDALLSQKNLSAADLETINAQYKEELDAVVLRGLRLSLNHAALSMTIQQASELILEVPRMWSEVYVSKYRVIDDTSLDALSISRAPVALNSTSVILGARDLIKRMMNGLDVLSSDKRLDSLISVGGYSPADLKSDLERFESLFFEPIFTGLFGTEDQASRSFIRETQLEIDELTRKISSLDQVVDDIRSFRDTRSDATVAAGGTESIQLSDNTLEQVLTLSKQASLSEYLTTILEERLKFANRRAELFTDIARSESGSYAIDKKFIQQSESELQKLVDEYLSLLDKSRQKNRQTYTSFYNPLGAPIADAQTWPDNSKLILALALVLGGMLACLIALVMPLREQSSK